MTEAPPVLLRRLLPPGEPADAITAIGDLRLADRAPADRPYVIANMIASADGKAAVQGASGGLGGPADRAVFRVLRTQADCVLAGAGTLRTERYGRLVRDPALRDLRTQRGLAADPVAATITRTLNLGAGLPLLDDPDSTLVIVTSSVDPAPAGAAAVQVERVAPERLDPAAALALLRERHGVRSVLCEGGPGLLGGLAAGGALDELFLTVSPLLVGSGGKLTPIEGPALPAPVQLQLVWAFESAESLFLRYRVRR